MSAIQPNLNSLNSIKKEGSAEYLKENILPGLNNPDSKLNASKTYNKPNIDPNDSSKRATKTNNNYSGKYDINKDFQDTVKNQGVIGKAWDKTKNIFGSSAYNEDGTQKSWHDAGRLWSNVINYDSSSEAVSEKLADNNISEAEKEKAVENYQNSQQDGVNHFANLAAAGAGVVAAGAVTASTLGVGTPGAIAVGAAAGAATKTAIMGANTIGTKQKFGKREVANAALTGAFDGGMASTVTVAPIGMAGAPLEGVNLAWQKLKSSNQPIFT